MSASVTDRYGAISEPLSGNNNNNDSNNDYVLQQEHDGLMRVPSSDSDDSHNNSEDGLRNDDDEEENGMSLQELLYSSSSYYAIAKPVTLTMVLAALTVVLVNTDETVKTGAQAMGVYQVWDNSSSNSTGATLATSLANALVMVTVICFMTFGIVILYHYQCMKCLISYMIFCSASLLGVLGGNLFQTAIAIYAIPVDKVSFYFFMVNFALVGVLAIFWGQGVPKTVTQGYLIATSVILAWHLSYFDDWTTWTLLFMLAIYDLCAVLTPCGPLKALVTLMSKDDAPEMPGLLFEADLPPEAKRPAKPTTSATTTTPRSTAESPHASSTTAAVAAAENSDAAANDANQNDKPPKEIEIPLAIAKVYQLSIVSVPEQSMKIMFPNRFDDQNESSTSNNVSASPLLTETTDASSSIHVPENPTPQQLRANVVVRLPANGGSIEAVTRRGKEVYLERDRHGDPKRVLWVDNKTGKVFAEMRSDDEDGPERNSIRLGLGDFIFYSVLVAKAAQYSFATFCACTLVILAGLGGTLVLLSVYGHALPALPISIFLGVVFYVLTRLFVEPWIEAVLTTPYYV